MCGRPRETVPSSVGTGRTRPDPTLVEVGGSTGSQSKFGKTPPSSDPTPTVSVMSDRSARPWPNRGRPDQRSSVRTQNWRGPQSTSRRGRSRGQIAQRRRRDVRPVTTSPGIWEDGKGWGLRSGRGFLENGSVGDLNVDFTFDG